jgi:hypothetical protein
VVLAVGAMVIVIVNTSPTARTRWPACASARLSLPSHRGWSDGSAMSSKILPAGAAISRLAVTTLGTSVLSATNPIQHHLDTDQLEVHSRT